VRADVLAPFAPGWPVSHCLPWGWLDGPAAASDAPNGPCPLRPHVDVPLSDTCCDGKRRLLRH
jgi:hypothetical protein